MSEIKLRVICNDGTYTLRLSKFLAIEVEPSTKTPMFNGGVKFDNIQIEDIPAALRSIAEDMEKQMGIEEIWAPTALKGVEAIPQTPKA